MHAQVAPEALDRIFLEIAVAAEQLQRIVDDIAPLSVASRLAMAENRLLSGALSVTFAAAR